MQERKTIQQTDTVELQYKLKNVKEKCAKGHTISTVHKAHYLYMAIEKELEKRQTIINTKGVNEFKLCTEITNVSIYDADKYKQ